MTIASIREFRLAGSGEEGLLPYLNEHGAFLGRGTPLLARDDFGDFVPLPQRDLEIVISAGFGVAFGLGSRMRGLATLAKALNAGDYALAAIALAQARFPALPDKGACARMQKAAAMLERGASAAEVLQRFLPPKELAKDNPYHLGPGAGGGQFTTAEMDGASSGDAKPRAKPAPGTKPPPPGAGPTTQPSDTSLPREIQREDGSTVAVTFNGRSADGLTGDQLVTRKLSDTLVDILRDVKDINSVNISATTNAHTEGDHIYGDALDVNFINGIHVDSSGIGLVYASELESAAMDNPNVRYVEGPYGNFVRDDSNSPFRRSRRIKGDKGEYLDQRHVHISVFAEH